MKKPDRDRDRPLKHITNALVRGGQALVQAWDILSHAEIRCWSKEAPQKDSECVTADGSPLNISELLRHVKLSLKLLGICNVQLVLKRRKDLSYLLQGSARELANVNRPITDHIFGENMAEDHEEVQKAFRLTQKLTKKIKPAKVRKLDKPKHHRRLGHQSPQIMPLPHFPPLPPNSSPFPQYQPGFQSAFGPQNFPQNFGRPRHPGPYHSSCGAKKRQQKQR